MKKHEIGTVLVSGITFPGMKRGTIVAYHSNGSYYLVEVTEAGEDFKRGQIYKMHMNSADPEHSNLYRPEVKGFEVGKTYKYVDGRCYYYVEDLFENANPTSPGMGTQALAIVTEKGSTASCRALLSGDSFFAMVEA